LELKFSVPYLYALITIPPYDELELFRQISQSDEMAFRIIFDRYVPKINAFLLKTVKDGEHAKELVQEVFLQLWLYRSSLKDVQHPGAYIHRIATNAAAHQFKKIQADRMVLGLILDETNAVAHDDQFQLLNGKELQTQIRKAIAELPAKRQEIFILSRESGLSRKEIADKLGISENTVKNQLTSAVNTLQQILKERTGILIPAILFFSAQ
jgi:RNA polymerase sigma-70 factor (family 1)